MYLNSHFVVTTGFLGLALPVRNEHFYFVRNMFMVAMALALIGYALYPTTPPRLYPGRGFTDTIAAFTGVAQDSRPRPAGQPVRGGAEHAHRLLADGRRAGGRALPRIALSEPRGRHIRCSSSLVIVVTGNHYWLDAAAGAAVACLAAVAARALARVRPAVWSWPEGGHEATA